MHPADGVAHPPGGWVLSGGTVWVRKRRPVVLECLAEAVFQGRLPEPTPRPHQQARHAALGLLELHGGGDNLRGVEDANSTLGRARPVVARQEVWGQSHRGGQLSGRRMPPRGCSTRAGRRARREAKAPLR
jgi:hypothetical protein